MESRPRSYQTGYDAASKLRLVRFQGVIDPEWLADRAPNDPTLVHLGDSVNLLDLRAASFPNSPAGIATLANRLSGLGRPDFQNRYAWLVRTTEVVGMGMLLRDEMGLEGRIRWFTDLTAALDALGVDMEAYQTVVGLLQEVEP